MVGIVPLEIMSDIPPTLVRDTMNYWLLQPDERLRELVRCYFVVDAGHSPYLSNELLLPDGHAELVFALDAGFERWQVGDQCARSLMQRSYVIGGRSHSVVTSGARRLRLVGAKIDPQLLRGMIRIPLSEFSDSILQLRDLNDPELLALEDQIGCCRRVDQIAAALDAFFLRVLGTSRRRDPLVDGLVQRIHRARGMSSIAAWTRDVPHDARTVERRFAAAMGMTPKKYARIVRFKHAYHELIRSREHPRSLVGRSLEGFYDQSHFIKECRRFLGAAPSALLAQQAAASTAVTDHLLSGELLAV